MSASNRRWSPLGSLFWTGIVAAVAGSTPAEAWIWPEHRDIAVQAITDLPTAELATLQAMWDQARAEPGPQLCPKLVDPGAEPATHKAPLDQICIDYASYPALAGDHSCSTADLRATASSDWGKKVVREAAETKRDLKEAGDTPQRTDAWNHSHLAMQGVDPKYLSRAAGNNAHFLIPRATIEEHESLDDYVARALAPATEINATGIYVLFHAVALRLAALYRAAPPSERPALGHRALLAEGIALHFLEDSFSSGHYAATWGAAAWQKGTHDLYSTRGLTTMTWGGELFASHGDAHMTDRDEKVASAAIGLSLAQVADAAAGRVVISADPLTPEEKALENLNLCTTNNLPKTPLDANAQAAAMKTLQLTPIPAGDRKSITPPRARADVGPFAGVVSGVTVGPAFGGYETNGGVRFRSELEVGARFGYGLEGLLTTNMDGQIWIQASFVNDPAQLDGSCSGCAGGDRENPALPRVPARSALKLVARMPYYVVPFDLILLAPILLLASPDAAQDVILTASSGGLLTVERPLSVGGGTLQLMAGREFGVTLWGLGRPTQYVATPEGQPLFAVNYKSYEFDFPVLEYTPPRAIATALALAAEVQLGFTVEFPNNATTVPSASMPNSQPFTGLGPSWFVYLRLRLDARKYFGGASEDWAN